MTSFSRIRLLALMSALVVGVHFPSAQAESLSEALRRAYQTNPTLQADRARQRATDELVPLAKSGWRPTIIAQGSVARRWSDTNVSSSSATTPLNLSVQLTQPVFDGFKTKNSVRAAKSNVKAGRENLLAVEQGVLLDAITAYMDVIRDRQLLAVRQRNIANLQKQASGAQARFDVGEVTRTDVSQARARVSAARGAAAAAQANLDASIARYLEVVGKKPGSLKTPNRAKLPSTLEAALDVASQTNPNILATAYVFDAARYNVKVAEAALSPTVDLEASASVTRNPQSGVRSSENAQIAGVVTVPIYQSGREYATIRQSKQTASQRQIEIISATRQVRQQVASAWAFLIAAGQAIVSAQAQLSAAQLALEGLNQEYQVGSRTTIDVLNAEQEVLNARITLITAQHDAIVASYQVLAAMGRLTARNLGLGGGYYDVKDNYRKVKDKWIGTDVETVE